MGTTIAFYSTAIILLIVSTIKDKKKTKMALKKAYKSFMNLLPALIPLVLFVGISLTLVSPELISRVLGEESGLTGVAIGAALGSIIFMPSFVAFSLGESLLASGAGYPQVAVFVATLMAVGISSMAIEIKYFNKKFTVLRNVMAFFAAIVFTIVVGVFF